jgi:hypothetical protein
MRLLLELRYFNYYQLLYFHQIGRPFLTSEKLSPSSPVTRGEINWASISKPKSSAYQNQKPNGCNPGTNCGYTLFLTPELRTQNSKEASFLRGSSFKRQRHSKDGSMLSQNEEDT